VIFRWDEWVPISRILKYNDENLKKQEELKVESAKTPAKRPKSAKKTQKDLKSVEIKIEPLATETEERFVSYFITSAAT